MLFFSTLLYFRGVPLKILLLNNTSFLQHIFEVDQQRQSILNIYYNNYQCIHDTQVMLKYEDIIYPIIDLINFNT